MYKRLLILLSFFVAVNLAQANIIVTDLSVEGRVDQPLGLDVLQPRLGWKIVTDADEKGVIQTSYHIQVASSRELLEQNQPDLWDTTKESDQSQYITYAGKTLKANQRCFWRVQVNLTKEQKNKRTKEQSGWSSIDEWGVGLLNEGNWKGNWIGLDQANEWDVEDEHSRLSARYYRTQFETKKVVKRATLHICGLGLYEASLNGQKVGNDVLTPAPSNYEKSIHYNSYDVTALLQTGTNQVNVTVSNGRFYTMQQGKKFYKIRNFGYPTLRANLIIEYADGKSETIATDDKKWQMTCDGAIRSSNEYDGEIYDANKEALPDSLWFKPQRSRIPNGELLGNVTPAMRILETLPVKEQFQKGPNRVIVDFGQNFAGWVRTDLSKLRLQKGDTLRIRYAEKLDSLGELYVENLRHAQSTDYYIANGKEQGTWAPRFAYHGGRYIEVKVLSAGKNSSPLRGGWVGSAEVVSDQMETLYTFECQNQLLNQLVKNAFWGIRSNYKGMPIDCPQRDERQPWLGDHTQGCYGESFLMDNQHLYNKWLRDIEESMRQDGCIPDVAPAFWNYYSDNVSWPSVFVFGADMLYQQFGDDKAIITHYPAMRKWMMHFFENKMTAEGLIKADKYADWCVTPEAPELIHSKDPSRVTDGVLIGSCYAYKLLELMMHFDDILLERIATDETFGLSLERRGMSHRTLEADRQEYADKRQALAEAINKKFLTVRPGTAPTPKNSEHYLYPDSTYYSNNALTANLLPLAFGIVPQEHVDAVTRQVVAKILLKPADGHLCCGVIGISWLLRELSNRGRMDVAYLLATQDTYPSWGYMAKQGATTIWELWNGDTANPKMNSGNHIMLLGDLLPWCFEHVGGIRAEKPGFKQIRLAPNFELEELSWANVCYQTPYGKVVSNWKKTPMHLSWDIEVPANTSAIVVTPNGEKTYGSGKHHIEEALPHKEATKEQRNTKNAAQQQNNATQLLSNEFLYESAPFPSCHSVSIAECTNGDLIATYFGGSYEGCEDMCIWTQRKKLVKRGKKGQPHTYEEGWSEPVLVADGALKPEEGKPWKAWAASDQHHSINEFNKMTDHASDTLRKAGYNPVIYQVPEGDLLLFYKLGYDVRDWTGYVMRSKDNGYTWTTHRDSIAPCSAAPLPLPPCSAASLPLPPCSAAPLPNLCLDRDSLLGPIKNQPICLPAGFKCKNGDVLKVARILAPTSKETGTGTKVKAGQWRCYVEISEDGGQTWALSPVVPERKEIRTIQPALLVHADGRLQMLCRTSTPKQKGREDLARIATSFSEDGGLTWSEMQLIDELPNNNSGLDAVTVFSKSGTDNTFYLIHNPFSIVDWRGKGDPNFNKQLRNPLYLSQSQDGLHWTKMMLLESSPISQYSYPSMIVGSDGTLHCVYTWRRERLKYQRVIPK